MDAIDDLAIEDWRDAMVAHAARSTVNGWLRVFRLILERAVRERLVVVNAARTVEALDEPRTKGKRGTSLDRAELRKLIETTTALAGEAISADIARHILLIAWTGVRMGESIALRFSDAVDGELRIERSVWHRHEKETKTDDPRRITIVGPLQAVLDKQRQWLLKSQHLGLNSGLVFPASPQHARAGASRRGVDELSWYRGHPVLNAPLALITNKAGIPPISPHSLRRTFEDTLRAAGVPGYVRRSLAGWRTEEAQAIYAQSKRSERTAAGEAMVNYVFEEAK